MKDYTQNGRFSVYEITKLPVDVNQLINNPDDAASYVDDHAPNCYLEVDDQEIDGQMAYASATPNKAINFLKRQAEK